MSSDERVDLVDEQDRVLGQVSRREMREQNLLHRTIAVMCANSAGEIYVHQRTDWKDVFPGQYDMFVGGVVSAGETYDACAVREIAEELNIVGPTPEFLFMHRYEGDKSRSHIAVYRVIWDGPIRHQASEIAWGMFFRVQETLDNSRGFDFVPDSGQVFQRIGAAG
jgi:8-oxo-dGTP pyrophosphatase MutT (NUDIX family)